MPQPRFFSTVDNKIDKESVSLVPTQYINGSKIKFIQPKPFSSIGAPGRNWKREEAPAFTISHNEKFNKPEYPEILDKTSRHLYKGKFPAQKRWIHSSGGDKEVDRRPAWKWNGSQNKNENVKAAKGAYEMLKDSETKSLIQMGFEYTHRM
jgi:hypothetical protein